MIMMVINTAKSLIVDRTYKNTYTVLFYLFILLGNAAEQAGYEQSKSATNFFKDT